MIRNKTIDSIAIILTFLFAVYGQRLLQQFGTVPLTSYFGRLAFHYAWWVIPVVTVLGLMFGFRNILKELCLDRGFLGGFLFGLLATLPMLISSAVIGTFESEINWLSLMHTTLLAGVMEEVLFRAFLFGILFRKLGWGFIPAALVGAIVFGLSHLYQGDNVAEWVALFLGTFIGSAWLAWLFIEWKENLWVPISLHVLMNFSWIFFSVSENALGDMYANAFRVVTIALTVGATILYSRKRDRFRVNRRNLFVNKES